MKVITRSTSVLLAVLASASLFLLGATGPTEAQQSGTGHQEHQEHAKGDEPEALLMEQLAEIRASVARLEAALERNHQGAASPAGASGSLHATGSMGAMSMGSTDKMSGQSMRGGMSGMMDMGSMGKGMMMHGMGQMSGQSMPGSGSMTSGGTGMRMGMGDASMKRMQMMGRMGGMGSSEPVAMLSRLPGFPGASHIYHIGASGFFLDHAELVDLSMDQRKGLAQIQEQALLEQSSYERRIDQAEQELWVLTSAGEPDAAAIEAKVREIANLTAEQRLSFIQSVGSAAEILTEEQRSALVGDLRSSFPETDAGSETVHDH